MASHIVGGEFELLHLTGNSYQLNMILYFDLVNGQPGALDEAANISIYRKSDNALITTVTANLVNQTILARKIRIRGVFNRSIRIYNYCSSGWIGGN